MFLKNNDMEFTENINGKKNGGNIETRYSREKRLEKAPEKVQEMHNPNFVRKRSLFETLTASRASRAVFFAITALAALNIGLYFFYYTPSSGYINGIKTGIESFVYNDEVFINIIFSEKKNKKEDYKIMEVSAVISAEDKEERISGQEKVRGVYIGSQLRLQCKFKKQNTEKIKAAITMNGKVLILFAQIK